MKYFAREAGNKLGSDHERFFRARNVKAAIQKVLTIPYTKGYAWKHFDLYIIVDENEPLKMEKVATI